MPRRSSLTARTLDHQGYQWRSLGGGLCCWSRAAGGGVEERIVSAYFDAAMAPKRLDEPVYVQRVDLLAEERGESAPALDEVYWPSLNAFLHSRLIAATLPGA